MTSQRERPVSSYLADHDSLTVTRLAAAGGEELFIAIGPDGRVRAFNGHVDLGTGIRTALAQIVAEELDVPFGSVEMVLGSTGAAPNQGATIASETIQVAAVPLRLAAATARAWLVARAAAAFGCAEADIVVSDGVARPGAEGNRFLSYGELIAGSRARLRIDPDTALKPVADYRVVGRAQPRVDIPDKATGAFSYVHDVRLPGMLHGRVVRPPYAGFDHGAHVGSSLVAVDEASVADVPGLVCVVTIGDFVGVVATREENAILAMQRLRVTWRDIPAIPDLNRPEDAIRGNPASPRKLLDRGDVDRALEGAGEIMQRSYVWPFQMHGSIGPSCAVADWRPDGLTVWSGTQNPFPMRGDLSRLMDMPEEMIVVERLEAAGCYGRNCADDVTADAALLSRAAGMPVRVQLTREQEHGWEPKGAGQVVDIRGGLDREGGPAAYAFETRYPSNLAPTLPLLLTGKIPPTASVVQMGDRTAVPPYAYGNMRVTVHDMPPVARASWFRGVSALPNSFAHESFIDELATAAGVDPIEYRLRYLHDPRAADLVRAVAERAKWKPHTGPFSHGGDGDILYGRGFAYALYVHGSFPGTAAAWSAWVADVAVNRKTGEIAVTRVVCGQDTGQVVNPDGVRHQIHGNVIQSTSRVLKEQVDFSSTAVESLEWGAYPILRFPEVPDVDVLMLPRPDDPPLGAGESASVPSAAAIANAIFDATGVRFRELPLSPERVRAALNPLPPPDVQEKPRSVRRRVAGPLAGAFAGALALGAAVLPWRSPIPPVERPAADVFSAATVERGRLAAALGACNVCHVGSDGTAFAGGRAFETDFGVIHAPNITPHPEAGIGAWSYPAFERAMRQGVRRDGGHLYPAHPYPSFAKAGEGDLQALYAYLMQQPASPRKAPDAELRFPFGIRPLMAAWNALYLSSSGAPRDTARGAAWNRGAELVEGLGHCSACHSDRNVLGAELKGDRHLGGGYADGWHAPALGALSAAPVGWTEDAFYDYLRKGRSDDHGPASGPMAHVVESLAPLPDADLRAMAIYLASLGGDAAAPTQVSPAGAIDAAKAAEPAARLGFPVGARIFEGACASCHDAGAPMASLALNSNLHADTPLNLIRTIMDGIPEPVGEREEVMAMPAFGASLSRPAIADLADYMRARFAPQRAAWSETASTVERLAAGAPARP
ncbi:MAG: molybdopterin-dependent oxidoreductase [Rhizobiaceae bacterium]|nr:molybdopterin-dependent oxidoreductase [Rhizobiaceae bacterium]